MKKDIGKSWNNLRKYYSCYPDIAGEKNPFFEPFTHKRYNPSRIKDNRRFRLIFLNRTLEEYPKYKTLVRDGRPVWCENMKYEGVSNKLRYLSFNLRGGKKRFTISENYCFLLPSRLYVYPGWPSRLGNPKSPCARLGSVFGYPPLLKVMYRNEKGTSEELQDFLQRLKKESPIRPGALVSPRIGLFRTSTMSQSSNNDPSEMFPHGLVIRREVAKYQELYGRELFTVSFGGNIIENVHPIEMEVIDSHEQNV
jgi:hypothetical protein